MKMKEKPYLSIEEAISLLTLSSTNVWVGKRFV